MNIQTYLTSNNISISYSKNRDGVLIQKKIKDNIYETMIEFKNDEYSLTSIEDFSDREKIICTGWKKGLRSTLIEFNLDGKKEKEITSVREISRVSPGVYTYDRSYDKMVLYNAYSNSDNLVDLAYKIRSKLQDERLLNIIVDTVSYNPVPGNNYAEVCISIKKLGDFYTTMCLKEKATDSNLLISPFVYDDTNEKLYHFTDDDKLMHPTSFAYSFANLKELKEHNSYLESIYQATKEKHRKVRQLLQEKTLKKD